MRILCIGDLHCRSVWKDIVAKEGDSCDKIVFLGDYTCPREVKFDDPTDACGFLYDVLDYKDQNPDKVILLRGNHDVQALGYYWARCFPYDHPKVQRYWRTEDVSNWFLKNTQWVYQIPDTNIVCSHAGISEQFLENVRGYIKGSQYDDGSIDTDVLIDCINTIEPCELFAFTPCKLSDDYGESATQPCTWIRPYTLLQYGVDGFTQVVGHTRVNRHICNIKDEIIEEAKRDNMDLSIYDDYKDVWCCDNLENREYLIIEDGEFKPCKI